MVIALLTNDRLIERLRSRAAPLTRARELSPTAALCREAADEIERLRHDAQPAKNAPVLTERLIQAAVDYEQGRCSSRELAEARAAVEAAMPGAAQSPVVWGATQEDVVAHAIMMDDGCGLTINGQRTLCDDPRAMEEPDRCYCRRSAKAALAALAAQPTAAPVEPTLSEIIREKMKQMAAEAGHFPSSAGTIAPRKTLDEFKEFLNDLADLNVEEPTQRALLAAREYIAEDNNPKSNRVLAIIQAALDGEEPEPAKTVEPPVAWQYRDSWKDHWSTCNERPNDAKGRSIRPLYATEPQEVVKP
jgi:hypothetical protein